MATGSTVITRLIFRLKNYIQNSFFEDSHNIPLWYVACYMFGIISYLAFNNEPSLVLLSAYTIIAALLSYFITRFRILFLFIFFFCLGINTIAYKSNNINFPITQAPFYNVSVSGVIDQIHFVEKGRRLILRDVKIGDEPPFKEFKVQVMIRSKVDLSIGEKIKFIANLYSTKENFMPRGYNFARHSFFQKVILTGYAVSKVQVIGLDGLSWQNHIDNLRQYIFQELRKYMPLDTASVAGALMIGDQKSIGRETIDNMRKSGLSHILAVSGLHLSLLSIICFFCIRYILSCNSSICQHYNTKKIAAYVALAATFFYLLVSGIPISAMRAFIMVSLVTLAVIIDREADSRRSVCFAAFVILVFMPEAVFTPSFQMSFVAVMALVAS